MVLSHRGHKGIEIVHTKMGSPDLKDEQLHQLFYSCLFIRDLTFREY